MRAVEVQAYLVRANDFLGGMKSLADLDAQQYRYSSALLAVHSAISYGDALWAGLGETKTAADDHKSRVPELKKLLNEHKYKTQTGLKHLQNLLRDKPR